MYGITFGDKHSYDDFNMILTGVNLGMPEPKRYTAEIPGANGDLDFTFSMTPHIKYEKRTVKFTFEKKGYVTDWDSFVSELMGFLHGQQLHVKQDTDPDYYWNGFCAVDSVSMEARKLRIGISCKCFPYRLKEDMTTYTKTGSGTLVCENSRMEVNPTITVTAETTIEFGDETITLSAGTYLMDFLFTEGDNELIITGTGTTTVTYREGVL